MTSPAPSGDDIVTPISTPIPDGDVTNCYAGITQDACANEPDVTDAKDACEKINKKSKDLWGEVVDAADAINPILAGEKAVESLANMFAGTNDTESDIVLSVKQQNNTVDVQQLFANCNAEANASVTQVIEGQGVECLATLEPLVESGAISADDLRTTQSDITQEATATANATCSVSSMMQNVSSLKTSTDQQAVLNVLQQASGMFSGNSANQNFCSAIDSTNNACSWMQQQNCCTAEANATAAQIIEGGCLTDQTKLVQKASATANATCSVSSTGTNSSDMSNYISQTVDAEVSQKAKGLSAGLLWFLIALAFFGPLLTIWIDKLVNGSSKILQAGSDFVSGIVRNSKGGPDADKAGVQPATNKKKTSASANAAAGQGGSRGSVSVIGGQAADMSSLLAFVFILAISSGLFIFFATLLLGKFNSTKNKEIDGMLNYPLSDCDSTTLSTMGDFASDLTNPFEWTNMVSDLGIGKDPYVGTRSTYANAVQTFELNDAVNGMDFFVDRDKVPVPSSSPAAESTPSGNVIYTDPTGVDGENPISADNPPQDEQMGTVMYINKPAYDPKSCNKIGNMNSEKFTVYTKAKATSSPIWLWLGIGSFLFAAICLGVCIFFIVVSAKSGSGTNVSIKNVTNIGKGSGSTTNITKGGGGGKNA